MRRLHRILSNVAYPIVWVWQHRSWWGDPPVRARWARPGDRKFTGRLMAGCAVIGIGGAVLYPYSFPIIGACWIGLLVALALFPTRSRMVLVILFAAAMLWPFYPSFFFGRECVPWPAPCAVSPSP